MNIQDIYNAIDLSSKNIINGSNDLKRRIKSTKNYVANQDMKAWAFSKLIATEYFDIFYGSKAKPFFYGYGFFNILEMKNQSYKEKVINNFLTWAKRIEYVDIGHKFNIDQSDKERFELLVHMDQIPKKILQKEQLLYNNLEEFVEGFKRQITFENSYRDRKLIKEAKEKLGTRCCVCKLNFEERYGLHGKGFIEMHHLKPIKEGKRSSTIKDLVPVCSNCHRMLHKGFAILSIADLKRIVNENATN